ncbi:MAG: GIY-YIG nuclease family protein [Clostridia bacterium]|nr:GIY-YIG nuclease family protein [Clostridia bacterium]
MTKKKEETHYVYILECRDGSLYTGWTPELEKRIQAHNSGKGAKYTKSRHPVTLRYFEEFATKSEALKREYAIKQLSREEKMKLIRGVAK